MTVFDFFYNHYLPNQKGRVKSIRNEESAFRVHIEDLFGSVPIEKISRHDLESWITKQVAKNLKHTTINKHIDIFNKILKRCEQWGFAQQGFYFSMKMSRLPIGDPPQRFLEGPEIAKLLKAAENDTHLFSEFIIKILLFTGCRVGELRKAKWTDIDIKNKTWRVPLAKGGRSRIIYLGEAARNVLRELKLYSLHEGIPVNSENFVLTNPKTGKNYNSFYCMWYRILAKSELSGIRIHDLRHTYASRLINGGASIYEVQKLLGHTTVNMTQRYAHLLPNNLSAIADIAAFTQFPSNNGKNTELKKSLHHEKK